MIGFIGTGNMASAIVKGLVGSKSTKPEEIMLFNKTPQKAQNLAAQFGAKTAQSAKELAQNCDCIVLSVKPNVIETVAEQIKEVTKEKKPLIISIAAGKTLEFLESLFGCEARIIRVMPNINAVVEESISAFCPNKSATANDIEAARSFCSAFGRAVEISESLFSIFSAIGGCSPAFVYMFTDSLARAAVKNGMNKALALEVAAQAVLGSAKMILQSKEHPWELIDKVCSPGGTTIEGVAALEKAGFQAAITGAVSAAFEKDQRL